MNEHRRVFRGRGGPTDRRLPKHNARRRKIQRPKPPEGVATAKVVTSKELEEIVEQPRNDNDYSSSDESVDVQNEAHIQAPDPCIIEVQHLLKRIQNEHTAMHLSTTSLSIPSNYRKHVVEAISNIIREWKSILNHYSDHFHDKNCTFGRSTGQAIFELIQQSLQVGPLAGGKPGYFKRCGSEVSQMVYDYLMTIMAKEEDGAFLCFTAKQVGAIIKWTNDAGKCAESGKPPSKSSQTKVRDARKN